MRNCEETTTFVKEYEKFMKFKKKGILSLAFEEGLLSKIFKEFDKFQEINQENGVSKTCKSVRKVTKIQSGNKFLKNR